jgi:hypothetical protein
LQYRLVRFGSGEVAVGEFCQLADLGEIGADLNVDVAGDARAFPFQGALPLQRPHSGVADLPLNVPVSTSR